MARTLIVVESPSKCKTIEAILGPSYRCVATFGHIRTLDGLASLDIPSYCPTYSSKGKMRLRCESLKREARSAAQVLVATDADREGEAIAWHVMEVLGIDVALESRVVFHEITESAVLAGVASPRSINMGLVCSQQARQMIDLLVGYTVSPYLWHIQSRLSAGRCQTPALRLVYERATEAVSVTRSYATTGVFMSQRINFVLSPPLTCVDEMRSLLFETTAFDHVLSVGEEREATIVPPDPLDTIGLQTSASSKLGMSPAVTMDLAQSLYEDGLITYMRTDVRSYAETFVESATSYIARVYGAAYTGSPNTGCSGAHEAIRPTDIDRILTGRDKRTRLYHLIRNATLASCMASSSVLRRVDSISAPLSRKYTRTSELTTFAGWRVIDGVRDDKGFDILKLAKPKIEPREVICSESASGGRKYYDEISLIKKLDALGIGRPSTFVSIVGKLIERGYAKIQDVDGTKIEAIQATWRNRAVTESVRDIAVGVKKKAICIQPIGTSVVEYLVGALAPLFDYDYTASLEQSLDLVSNNVSSRGDLCRKTEECIRMRLSELPPLDSVPCRVASKSRSNKPRRKARMRY